MKAIMEKLYQSQNLAQQEAEEVFGKVVIGELSEIEITALLVALKVKGETPEEIAGAAKALRAAAAPFERPNYLIADSCGTGGDGANTINISTAVSMVAAECGLPMVKHGNRSISSKCGSADLLEALGINLNMSAATARKCLDAENQCFFFTPAYHSGVKYVMPVRTKLATRTIFNVLGPLINPASPQVQIMGVYDPELCMPLANTLKLLGCESALVVHGSGVDEIVLHGETTGALLKNGEVSAWSLTPESVGLERTPLSELEGGEAEQNKAAIEAVLSGQGKKAHEDAIALNTAVLLHLAEKVDSIEAGIEQARAAMKSGKILDRVKRFAALSQES